MTDDLTRRLAEQILRGMKELHKERNPSEPLSPGTQSPRTRLPNASGSALLDACTRRWSTRKSAIGIETEPAYGDVVGEP